jgi:hypothetical protein
MDALVLFRSFSSSLRSFQREPVIGSVPLCDACDACRAALNPSLYLQDVTGITDIALMLKIELSS